MQYLFKIDIAVLLIIGQGVSFCGMQGVINKGDLLYPSALALISDAPKKLYWKGILDPDIFSNCLAVVGSRKMSPYGQKVIELFFTQVSKKLTIVSGFMYGVDTKAHEEALKNGLRTVAVLPCGIDFMYPKEHYQLYADIVDSGGLILSEYEGSTGPRTWTYLRRNRIVAGLSKALLVIEASEKSGSLNTAELARKYNREVLAVPGNIFSEVSKGCLHLIKEFASPVVSGFDINERLNLDVNMLVDSRVQKGSGVRCYDTILSTLRAMPLTLDDLSVHLSIPITTLSSKVTQLCVMGKVVEKQGRFYAC